MNLLKVKFHRVVNVLRCPFCTYSPLKVAFNWWNDLLPGMVLVLLKRSDNIFNTDMFHHYVELCFIMLNHWPFNENGFYVGNQVNTKFLTYFVIRNATQDKVFHLFLLLIYATWKNNTRQKYIFTWETLVMFKIHYLKNSISLTLFHHVYFKEIVIIVGRQS